jgi:hypothetical protein
MERFLPSSGLFRAARELDIYYLGSPGLLNRSREEIAVRTALPSVDECIL